MEENFAVPVAGSQNALLTWLLLHLGSELPITSVLLLLRHHPLFVVSIELALVN